jgi:hypothetical protein
MASAMVNSVADLMMSLLVNEYIGSLAKLLNRWAAEKEDPAEMTISKGGLTT